MNELTQYNPQSVEELRESERKPVDAWQASVFTEDQLILTDTLIDDSSTTGAGCTIHNPTVTLDKGVTLTITVDGNNQRFTRKATVRWAQNNNGELRFGIEYIDHVGYDPGSHDLDISGVKINPACALSLPSNIAIRQKALPFIEIDGIVHIACLNPENNSVQTLLRRLLKKQVCLWQADAAALNKTIEQVYGDRTQQLPALAKPDVANEDSEAVSMGEGLLYAAFIRQASDIHIDPDHNGANIRFRVDGQLELYNRINTNTYTELASRLKVMSSLDIAEKRSPQDGRFTHEFKQGKRRVDIRVATLPTKYGERITMRLLAMQTEALTLPNLGFTPDHQGMIEKFLRRIQGMMIMTGPTGSGKTTTLYAAIRMLIEERNLNIITIEDPIEYEVSGIAQCEVDGGEKVTFAKALRSILRHDPDVVMIGEIRDKETADIAIKAALTGHMVLGTLHTNSAAATVTRFIDMGVEPYLVAAALRLAVAQRLLRRLCKHCKIERPLTELEAIIISRPELRGTLIHDPSGCIYCAGTGYSGRIGLYEMLNLNENWARNVADGMGETELVVKMREAGINSLLDDAIDKLLLGVTSISEVSQIASSW